MARRYPRDDFVASVGLDIPSGPVLVWLKAEGRSGPVGKRIRPRIGALSGIMCLLALAVVAFSILGSPGPATAAAPLQSITTAEGVTINVYVNTVTPQQVYDWLKAAGLQAYVGLVQVDVVDSGLTYASTGGGCYADFSACWVFPANIQVTDDNLLSHPYYTLGHEYGHVWANYYQWTYWRGSLDSYLLARGISPSDPRLNYGAIGCSNPVELIAEDYRQLFAARETNPSFIIVSCGSQLGEPEPENIPGFRDWLGLTWTQNHPPPGYSGSASTPTPTPTASPTGTATPTPTATATTTTPEASATPTATPATKPGNSGKKPRNPRGP